MTPSPDLLFSLASNLAVLGWVLLIFLPRWRGTRWLILSWGLPLALAFGYTLCIGRHYLGDSATAGGFGSLAAVAALFQDPWALLAGWVHYLCFDLALGAWEMRDAQRRGVPHILLVPALLLTFLFGPVGFLLYHVLRRFYESTTAAAAF